MRRLLAAVAATGGAGFDGVEAPFAAGEVGDDASPAAKARLDFATAFGMGVVALGVGLPGFEQYVCDGRAGAVEHYSGYANALADGVGPGDVLA